MEIRRKLEGGEDGRETREKENQGERKGRGGGVDETEHLPGFGFFYGAPYFMVNQRQHA